ncbi:MAG: hypothetical protein ACYTE8_12550 [Planctomycetota bacterium]|jgi:hypothetical protein
MRFLAILRKEMRECLPWLLLAGMVFLFIGGFFLSVLHRYEINSFYNQFESGRAINSYYLLPFSNISITGIWLLVTSLGLGLVLGARQFCFPFFTRLWGFTLHRSSSRLSILFAKITAALIAFSISLGMIWSIFYSIASSEGFFLIPPPLRIFIEGWIYILMGFIAYLGAAQSSLSTNRWYTTKIFGLATAVLVIVITCVQWNLWVAFGIIIVGIFIILSQIIHILLNREF